MTNDIKRFLKESKITREIFFLFYFIYKNQYIPNIKNPKTFNEKIIARKNRPANPLFSVCADKIDVKQYVARNINLDFDIIIPTFLETNQIYPQDVKKLLDNKGPVVIKANHNSGPVYPITSNSSWEDISNACDDINNQLKKDYGANKNEKWYSEIKPRILIEKNIQPKNSPEQLEDYKFHVFNRLDKEPTVILQIDFSRGANHSRSFFSQDLEWLPFSCEYPTIKTSVERPQNYLTMLDIAKKLALPFSYARVDLYNVQGTIYFGEITFAHGGGSEPFSTYAHDVWMGNFWEQDVTR